MIPKFNYVRSAPLMEAYRKLECQACGMDDGTVCGAHSNWAEHGKGRSIKASDVFCASLCSRCHWWLDQGLTASREERKEMWRSAWRKTIAALVVRGLWPKTITPPETGNEQAEDDAGPAHGGLRHEGGRVVRPRDRRKKDSEEPRGVGA